MKLRKNKITFIVLSIFLLVLAGIYLSKKAFPYDYREYIEKYSAQYNLDHYLVASLIRAESNFDAKACSNKNAIGLMQITEDTGKWAAQEMGIKNFNKDMLKEPEFNIRMGCWYLDNLKKEFNGDMNLVLAAYNGGRGNVQKWLKNEKHSKDGKTLFYIPFKETDKYIKKIKVNYNVYKLLYD